KFAAEHKGVLPAEPVNVCCRFLTDQGLKEVDEERLATVLPPIFAEQSKVEAAAEELKRAKAELATQLQQLAAGEIEQRAAHLTRLHEKIQQATRDIATVVRHQLADEAKTWEAIKRREADLRAQQERAEAELAARIRLAEEEQVRLRDEVAAKK